MNSIKHFCRLVTPQELDDETVITYFDIVQSVTPAKLVTAYSDEAGGKVSIEVIGYTDPDEQTHNVYEIVLQEDIDEEEGDLIAKQLEEEFDFDFEFEASVEI